MSKTKEDAISNAEWFMIQYGDVYCTLKLLNDAAAGLDDDSIQAIREDVLARLPDDNRRTAMKALFELLTYYRARMSGKEYPRP